MVKIKNGSFYISGGSYPEGPYQDGLNQYEKNAAHMT